MDPDISNNQQEQTVSGLFNDRNSMERAWDMLSARGYTKEEISILMSEQTRNTLFPEDPEAPHVHIRTTTEAEHGSQALEGTGIAPDKALLYAEGLKQGKILMTVKTRNQDDADHIENVWHNHYADNH